MHAHDKKSFSIPCSDEFRFRHLVESFALAVWEADPLGCFLPSSSTWAALTGQCADLSSGRGWLDAVHPDDREGVELAWQTAVSSGKTYQHEYRLALASRDWVWTLAHAAPFRDEQGQVLKWMGMNVDISARKAAEHALKEAGRQKNEFIAILAHELRNPLAPLRSSIELMLSTTATASAKARALALMNQQICHLSRLVEDLVDASRIATGKLLVHPKEMRLLDALHNSVDNIEPAANAKHQEIVFELLDDIDPIVNADPVRLNQAFVNVLNNSVKFSPEHSKIDITVRRRDEHVSVTIRDRGRAMPKGDCSKIFDLFVQSARHDSGDGLGIGLALARDVLTLHEASIEARIPSDGVGTEFEIVLPVVRFGAGEFGQGGVLAPAAAHSVRVLVVDDNADAAETLGALLEMSGQTVRIVHDGRKAVDEAAVFLPEVVFMDLGMPVMGGLEATRHIRASNPSVRPFIVALTGWGSEADRASTKDAGFDLHLAKPAELDDLLSAIERACLQS